MKATRSIAAGAIIFIGRGNCIGTRTWKFSAGWRRGTTASDERGRAAARARTGAN